MIETFLTRSTTPTWPTTTRPGAAGDHPDAYQLATPTRATPFELGDVDDRAGLPHRSSAAGSRSARWRSPAASRSRSSPAVLVRSTRSVAQLGPIGELTLHAAACASTPTASCSTPTIALDAGAGFGSAIDLDTQRLDHVPAQHDGQGRRRSIGGPTSSAGLPLPHPGVGRASSASRRASGVIEISINQDQVRALLRRRDRARPDHGRRRPASPASTPTGIVLLPRRLARREPARHHQDQGERQAAPQHARRATKTLPERRHDRAPASGSSCSGELKILEVHQAQTPRS